MTITAEILADSTNPCRRRLITFKLRYPRYIHSEIMTHRVFSRNASSSRAIPIEKMIQDVLDDPVEPIFMENQKGMTASVPLEGWKLETAKLNWHQAKLKAISHAQSLSAQGIHKQIANRLLEPFSHINVVLSGTDFSNFFSQRISPNAQQEICELAVKMKTEKRLSEPKRLSWREWHIPFILPEEEILQLEDKIKISAARCARVSYNNFSNNRDISEDFRLYDSLVENGHWSPLEHVAQANYWDNHWDNLKGFRTHRNIKEYE